MQDYQVGDLARTTCLLHITQSGHAFSEKEKSLGDIIAYGKSSDSIPEGTYVTIASPPEGDVVVVMRDLMGRPFKMSLAYIERVSDVEGGEDDGLERS